MAEKGLKTACITKVFPTRSHTVAAQGGISAALGNMGEDDWRWHMYDTVKGRTGWATRTRSSTCAARRCPPSSSLSITACRSRAAEGKIYQRAFGGMTTKYGEGRVSHMRRRRPYRPRHPPHPVSAVAEARGEFFVEYFALDLIMDEEGVCRGVMAWNLDDGTIHRFNAHLVVLATGGYGRSTSPARPPTPAPVTATRWCCARACRSRTWSSCSSIRPASTVRAA